MIVARTWLLAVMLAVAGAPSPAWGQKRKAEPNKDARKPREPEPPEEDESLKVEKKEYSFNPIQAAKEIQVGNYYFKKGSFRSARLRFEEATKWDANNAEAWARLGEACEKLKDAKGSKEAFEKYLELDPDGKYAAGARKKLAGQK